MESFIARVWRSKLSRASSAELSRALVLGEKRFKSNSHGLAMVSSSQLICVGANPTGLATV